MRLVGFMRVEFETARQQLHLSAICTMCCLEAIKFTLICIASSYVLTSSSTSSSCYLC
jgi:hypothetical protein